MTFRQWLLDDNFDNPSINGQWKALHIITLVICIALIIGVTLLLKNKDDKIKRRALLIISSILLFFEIARRIVNIINPITFTKYNLLWVLLPRPGCAISVWLVMLSPFINKKWFYNFTSIVSILCGVFFFAYPGAGFLHKYIQFEDLYSIVSHSLFFVGAFLIVTLKLAKFNYRDIKYELVSFVGLVGYSLLEMFVFTKNSKGDPLELDPFYILANNEVQEIVGLKSHTLYLVLYILFIIIYIGAFYFFSRKKVK